MDEEFIKRKLEKSHESGINVEFVKSFFLSVQSDHDDDDAAISQP